MGTSVRGATAPAADASPSPNQPPDTPAFPDDPGQQLLPTAKPEPLPPTGLPARWESLRQTHAGDLLTLEGEVVLYYRNYIVHADKVVYHQSTDTVEAEGHIQVEGGPDDAVFTASHGEIHIQQHTAKFYDVTGSFGLRRVGQTKVYTTPNPFLFTGRMLIQSGEGIYRVVDGTMTSCRLPQPDWQIISHAIDIANDKATTHNSIFQALRIPLLYLPFLQHNINDSGRESGFLFDGFEDSTVKGLVLGEQVYWAINRSNDLTVGAQYWSQRGFAPNGVYRYRGPNVDNLIVRWNALLDRGVEATVTNTDGTTKTELLNQGGADISAVGRKDLTENARISGVVEYLSSYIYRLAFDENLAQATSSQVLSDAAYTWNHNGYIPSVTLERFQSFGAVSSTDGNPVTNVPEARILHLPSLRFDVTDRPLAIPAAAPLYWGMGSSIGDLDRAVPNFHARNVGRFDLYPHLEWPLHLGDWSIEPEVALRMTQYSGSQTPDLNGTHFDGTPFVNHTPLTRGDFEASIDIRPPAIERDFTLTRFNRELRHVIEPEIYYRYVGGIHSAPDILQFDMTDIATNTSEAGFSLTQRFYLKPLTAQPCHTAAGEQRPGDDPDADQTATTELCDQKPREWASWQIAQKFFANSDFSDALIPGRRNVFNTTLDLTGVAFLTAPRSIAPIISRLRFEAIDNLRVEWDLDYDSIAGRLSSNNLFAGYSFHDTTVGVGHALLNAVDESGSTASSIQSQEITPFLYIGKPANVGLNLAFNASYDFAHDDLQYAGAEAIYNWNCCGLTLGYRRFALGTLRDEGEWLWGFTLAGLGTAGDVHRSNSVFPAPDVLKHIY